MTSNIVLLTLAGVGLHVVTGWAVGRVLVVLRDSGQSEGVQRKSAPMTVYVLGLGMMIGYGYLAGHLAKALKEFDGILIIFAGVMLLSVVLAYRRKHDS